MSRVLRGAPHLVLAVSVVVAPLVLAIALFVIYATMQVRHAQTETLP